MSRMHRHIYRNTMESLVHTADSYQPDQGSPEVMKQLRDLHSSHKALEVNTKAVAALESLHTIARRQSEESMARITAKAMQLAYAAAVRNVRGLDVPMPSLECFSGPMSQRAVEVSAVSIEAALNECRRRIASR